MHRLWKFSSAILLDKEPLCSHQLPCPSPPVSDPDLLTCISERFLKFSWGIWPLPSPLSNWGSETGGHCTARLNSVSISWLSSYNSPIMETLGQTLTGSTTLPKPLFLVFNPFSKITCTYPKDDSATFRKQHWQLPKVVPLSRIQFDLLPRCWYNMQYKWCSCWFSMRPRRWVTSTIALSEKYAVWSEKGDG